MEYLTNETRNRLSHMSVKQSPDLYKILDSGVLLEHPDSAEVQTSRHTRWQLDPVSFTAGQFTNNPILFRITPSYCDKIEQVYLEWKVSETGGSNTVTPLVAPYQLDRIEIGVNGSPEPFKYCGKIGYMLSGNIIQMNK